MLFPEESPSEYVLSDLADEIAGRPAPEIKPLPCDRWIARSALQKAIRRAEPVLAVRALANLHGHDRRSMWRALIIIALEDVGVANIDVLARIIAAHQDRRWRGTVGGDWAVVAELVRQMAESNHCQAACDLLLRSTNDPSCQPVREEALELKMGELIDVLADSDESIVRRGICALAASGCLVDGQLRSDPAAVFDTLAELSHFSHVVSACRPAWRISRNPMALLLPLIWQTRAGRDFAVADDVVPAVQLTSAVPGYSLDQFTRRGNTVSRTLLAECADLRGFFDAAGVRRGDQVSTVGDLIFLIEGGRVRNRMIWSIGDHLRLPHRWLPAVPRLGSSIGQALRLLDAKGSQIAKLRRGHLYQDCLD